MPRPNLDLFSKLPRFPDGRINYTNSAKAAVVSVIIKYKDNILLLKRSDKVGNYRGKWNVVAGYLDDETPIREKALAEVREETGITNKDISAVKIFSPITIKDNVLKKIFIAHISLIALKSRPKIKLDWEHTAFKWVKPQDVRKFDVVYGLDKLLRRILRN